MQGQPAQNLACDGRSMQKSRSLQGTHLGAHLILQEILGLRGGREVCERTEQPRMHSGCA